MKKTLWLLQSIGMLLVFFSPGIAQGTQTALPTPPAKISAEEIIKRFTEKESELRQVWTNYAYQQESKYQLIGPANTISADFYQVSEFVFSDDGKRIQRIIKAPPSALEQMGVLTKEDKDALINLQPFALTMQELPNYKVSYVGKEKLDDLQTYVFEVVPKVLSDPREMKRLKDQKMEGKYFQGRIWVDDQDLQIVKTAGKVVPEFAQRFPKFETYRENIDGRYWFPTYTYGDDVLHFEKGPPAHVRMIVRYKNYRQFSGDVKFKVEAEVPGEEAKEKPTGEIQSAEGKKDASSKPTDLKTVKPESKETEKKPVQPAKPPKKP